MSAPVVPNEFKEAIPSPGGSFCEKFIRALNLPYLVWKFVSWMIDENGEFTSGFKSQVCALDCMGGSTDGGGTGTFEAPSGVSATDGEYYDKVRVTWNAVTDATIYDVYRNTINSSSLSTLIESILSDGARLL